jgi:hypothetical protein
MFTIDRYHKEGKLTGRRRYRRGWFNRVILQVEVEVISIFGSEVIKDSSKPLCRDAKPIEVGLSNKLFTQLSFLSYDFEINKVVEKPCSGV